MKKRLELETRRLLLRSVSPSYLRELFQSTPAAGIMELFGADEKAFAQLKQMYEAGLEMYNMSQFYFHLFKKDKGQLIGECGFHTWNRKHRRAELFYSLRQDEHKQNGYMSEALACVLEYGFSELGLHRIAAMTAEYNTPSIRLLQKYGFTHEGVLREDYSVNGSQEDSLCFSLLEPEWRQQHPIHSHQINKT